MIGHIIVETTGHRSVSIFSNLEFAIDAVPVPFKLLKIIPIVDDPAAEIEDKDVERAVFVLEQGLQLFHGQKARARQMELVPLLQAPYAVVSVQQLVVGHPITNNTQKRAGSVPQPQLLHSRDHKRRCH